MFSTSAFLQHTYLDIAMYKYNGLLIHQSCDEEGLIEVVDNKDVRSLHFGNETRQSSLQLSAPHSLYSRYAQAMMGWLLFKRPVDNALMIGLGGGILANYFLYHFKDCYFRAVEYRRDVVRVARSHFGLPYQERRLKVLIGDGGDYMRTQSLKYREVYPLILVDAFDDAGISDAVIRTAFFDNCKALLKKEGVLVINLWNSDKALYLNAVFNLQQTFDDKVLFLPVRGRGNVIAFAFNDGFQQQKFKQLIKTAQQLQQQYLLDFPLFLKDFRTHNPKNFKYIVRN